MTQAPASGRSGNLTASQYLLWTGQRLDHCSPLYNMALAVTIEGPLSRSAFTSAFHALVARNEALRTVFSEEPDGTPRRRVLRVDQAPGLLMKAFDGTDEALLDWLRSSAQKPFPLDSRLFEALLISRGSQRSVFFLNQHHLITDAWATGALYRQLNELYGLARVGRLEEAADAPSFEAYVEHEATVHGSVRYVKARRHWEDTAPAERRSLRFYGKTTPRTEGSTRRVRRRLDGARSAALKHLAARDGFRAMTAEQARFQILAAVLGAWTHRVTEASRISIGVPWHNRSQAKFRDTLGLFVELFPLRLTIAGSETLSELVEATAAAAFDMMRHAVPGCSALPQTRDFEVVLNVITAALGDFAGFPTSSDWIHSGYGDPNHKVRLQVYDFDRTGNATLDFDLNEDLFTDIEAGWAVDHFMRILDAMLADPDARLDHVALATWGEAATFMPETRVAEPATNLLLMFERQVRSTPANIAVVDADRTWTYAELAEMVAAVRAAVERQTSARESVLGVCADHSVRSIAAWLGVLEAGKAFLPLDPGHPDDRIAAVLNDAEAAVVFADSVRADRAKQWGVRSICIDEVIAPSRSGTSRRRPVPLSDDDLAYVIYTSGSTGRPKGVEVAHGAIADYVSWAIRTYCDGQGLSFPLFTSPAFDLTLTSVLVPLLSGGRVVVYRQETENDFVVRRVFEDDRVDVVKLTPSHLALIRDLPLDRSRVRRLVVGGENLRTDLAAAIREAFGRPVDIVNEYGPTEATVGCMVHHYDPARDTGPSVPIGVPADNTAIYVLDASGQPVPRGVSGEIHISGTRVARGYRRRPQETAVRFLDDPRRPGTRMYRTGDRARWNQHGLLEFLGRSDTQVKVRGVRLELGEIEAALTAHPAINEAAVLLVERGAGGDFGRCQSCGIEGRHPDARLDVESVCAICRGFERQRGQVARYFGTMDDLQTILADAKANTQGPYDCLMLYSGGKDSTYALSSIVDMGACPLVFLLDNGYISDQAKQNVRRVVDMLGLDLHEASTPAMPDIFADSLRRYSNVCNGCFKTIYTLATQLAKAHGLRHIVTGLSRGQIFETRLAEIYRRGIFEPEEVDRTIIEARKVYHRMDDAVSRAIDCSVFSTDDVFTEIQFVDFYRYSDTPLDDILAYLDVHTPWLRPSDTGRSTNCRINELGIFVHTKERGFHNYSLPYSWDVRLGHKRRSAAVEELDDPIDAGSVQRMLREVGYRVRTGRGTESSLIAYYVADREIPVDQLRSWLERRLPAEAIPVAYVLLDTPPLTSSGKLDRRALATVATPPAEPGTEYAAPQTETETALARIWSEILGRERVGVHDNFFELGGDSIQCVQIVAAARERGLVFTARDLFADPTIATLAPRASRAVETVSSIAPQSVSDREMAELLDEFGGGQP